MKKLSNKTVVLGTKTVLYTPRAQFLANEKKALLLASIKRKQFLTSQLLCYKLNFGFIRQWWLSGTHNTFKLLFIMNIINAKGFKAGTPLQTGTLIQWNSLPFLRTQQCSRKSSCPEKISSFNTLNKGCLRTWQHWK